MAEVINLRIARKQAKRTQQAQLAERNRAHFGRSKQERELARASAAKMQRQLDAHRIEPEDAG